MNFARNAEGGSDIEARNRKKNGVVSLHVKEGISGGVLSYKKNLNTDWTAQRMIGYLSHYEFLPLEEAADEMLAILSDRDRIMQKKFLEETNAAWNAFLNTEFDNDEE